MNLMSKGSKQQYKQYTINSIEDACIVLKGLIVPVVTDLQKFQEYSSEAKELLARYASARNIPASEYESIHDKVLYRQREILRFLADHQSSSFSYIGVRKLFEKKGYLKRSLPEESTQILNELLYIRNWSFHNTQSMLVADLETAKKSIPPELAGMVEVKPMLNPVVIHKVKNYNREMLEGFIFHNEIREKQFELILSEMKMDYQELFDSLPVQAYVITNQGISRSVEYIEHEILSATPERAGSEVASMSMKIQKGKYDGK